MSNAAPSQPFVDPRLTANTPAELGGVLDLTKAPLGADAPDPDVMSAGGRDASPSPLLSQLEQDLAELTAVVELPDVLIVNRRRDGFAARYSIDFDGDDLKKWQKAATKGKGDRAEIDGFRLAAIVLANLIISIERPDPTTESGWRAMLDDRGEFLTFRSPVIQQMYGVARAGDAVKAFYVQDTYMVATMDAVTTEAGVGENVQTVDPTDGSSI